MIRVSFQTDREQGLLRMELRGHAGFAELGKDPVCAGASVLAMTVAHCVTVMEKAGRLREKPALTIRAGRVSVTAKPRKESFDEARHLFWVGEAGLRLLAEAYPGTLDIRGTKPGTPASAPE